MKDWIKRNISENTAIYFIHSSTSALFGAIGSLIAGAVTGGPVRSHLSDGLFFATVGVIAGAKMAHDTIENRREIREARAQRSQAPMYALVDLKQERLAKKQKYEEALKKRVFKVLVDGEEDPNKAIEIDINQLDYDKVPNFADHPFAKHLKCPITQEYFKDPVCAGDGHTYEREALGQWWLEGNLACPLDATKKLENPYAMPTNMDVLFTAWEVFHEQKAKLDQQKQQNTMPNNNQYQSALQAQRQAADEQCTSINFIY
jgi:hypothetical protein